MNYYKIRKLHFKTQRRRYLDYNSDLDDWFYSPYTFLKSRLFTELSPIFVFFLQYTPIKPNWISLFYAVFVIIGGVLLSSGIENMIIAGVIFFFFCGIIDDIDGLLARLKKQTSELGALLDDWGPFVGTFCFLIGLGMYLYNATQEIHFIYLMILIITIKALDLKDYAYLQLIYKFCKNKKDFRDLFSKAFLKKLKDKEKITKKNQEIPSILITLKKFFQGFLDNRSRTVDSIGLIILIELSYDKIILTNYIYYLILFKWIAIFLGGFYLVYYKEFIRGIILKLRK